MPTDMVSYLAAFLRISFKWLSLMTLSQITCWTLEVSVMSHQSSQYKNAFWLFLRLYKKSIKEYLTNDISKVTYLKNRPELRLLLHSVFKVHRNFLLLNTLLKQPVFFFVCMHHELIVLLIVKTTTLMLWILILYTLAL